MKSKFSTAWVLLLCCLRFVFYGKATNKVINPKWIVVAQIAQLGDMVCTTPVFRAIKNKYSGFSLTVVGRNEANGSLLRDNADIDEYIVYDGNFFKFLKKIKDHHFDVGLIVVPNFWILAAFYLAGIPSIVATKLELNMSPSQSQSYLFIHRFVYGRPLYYGQYFPRQYLKVLEPLGIMADDTTKHLKFSENAKQKIDKLVSEHRSGEQMIIGISPSAGNKIKTWPAERFAELADYIYEKHKALIIIIGASSDEKEVNEMIKFLDPQTKVWNTSSQLNVDELKALISMMNLFIAVDTGPIYIAEAFNVPTIDIVGPIDEAEQPPIGSKHRVIISPLRKEPSIHLPQMHVMNARGYDYNEARIQVESISVDMAINEFDNLIENI